MQVDDEGNTSRLPAELIPKDFDEFDDDGQELEVPDSAMDIFTVNKYHH